ncbi:MAG: DUF1016 family protein [Oscillospiraceae bacterium]|nr:DUF1016 family protein [Oscillospiraceae bacterium]
MSNIISIDEEYKQWIKKITSKYRSCQIKAAVKVNVELLTFYWNLGKDIVEMQKQKGKGTNTLEQISKDLRRQLPDAKGFSKTNLFYITVFSTLYLSLENNNNSVPQLGEQVNTELDSTLTLQELFSIPWGHHKLIIDKCGKSFEKACFYVKETLINNWSRAMLLNFIDSDLYSRKGKAISNFNKTLPPVTGELAQEMTRDPYCFDFLTLSTPYCEKELKDALMDNITHFMLELGKSFAFVGREYHLVVGKTDQFIDMLFYNITLHCYVVVEVKIREFQPADIGQLSTYVSAVDGLLCTENDNRTVGLLICKTKDNVLAKYAVNGINLPLGISEYELSNLLPDNFKNSLPTIEEIENGLK